MLIIPDTNFLIYLTKYRLWHQLEQHCPRYSLLILPQVAAELEHLRKKGKDKESALLALEIVKKLKVKPRKGHADRAILQIAQWFHDIGETNFAIATMDKQLKRKLKQLGAKVLTIRQKHYIENG